MGILDEHIKIYNEYIDKEFKKTLKIVKKEFKQNNWRAPRDWKQIIDWHYFKYKGTEGYKRPNIKDEKIFLEWAKSTNESNIENPGVNIGNKFNQMKIEDVRNHFLPLIKTKNPKKVIWMTTSDFEIFLKRSFDMQTDLSKPKINLGHGAKYATVKLFYKFYEKCQNEYLTQNRNKDPFVELLKNAFDTSLFNDLTNENFKGDKSKYEWD